MINKKLLGGGFPQCFQRINITPELMQKIRNRREENKKRLLLSRGCKIFNFGEVEILALNRKNAERKYNFYYQ
jgi:hypothetical protein